MSGGLPSWARKGVKVIYIGCPAYRLPQTFGFAVDVMPLENVVYTIRDVELRDGKRSLRLAEMAVSGRWPDGRRYTDAWLGCRAFRPLVSTKTEDEDLAHFRPYLHQNAPEGIDA